MKKYFYLSTVALTTLFAASCAQEDIPGINDEGLTTFRLSLPEELGTRFGEGETAKKLQVAVYDNKGNLLMSNIAGEGSLIAAENVTDFTGKTAAVKLDLVKGETYNIVFWAYAEGAPYTLEPTAKTVKVSYDNAVSGDEKRDAFYNYITYTVGSAASNDVALTRPFAQINIGTNDINEAKLAGMDVSQTGVGMKFAAGNLATQFNFAENTSTAAAENDVVFGANKDITDTFPVEGYEYLSMAYVLVPTSATTNKALLDIAMTVGEADIASYSNVPAMGNYRTNIYGSLLTSKEQFTVDIEPNFAGEDINIVRTESDFVNAFKEGGEVILNNDIKLTTPVAFHESGKAKVDLNGHTLTSTVAITVPEGGELEVVGSSDANSKGTIAVAGSEMFRQSSGSKLTIGNTRVIATKDGTRNPNSLVLVDQDDCEVNIKNSEFYVLGAYALTTNANTERKNIVINLENSKFGQRIVNNGNTSYPAACPTMINLPVNLTAKNCEFDGCNSAIMLRGGTYHFEGCTFTQTLAFNAEGTVTTVADIKNLFHDFNRNPWGSGNNMPLAGVVMGNQGTAYQYPTNVTMNNCTINVPEVAVEALLSDADDFASTLPSVYAYANQGEGLGVTFNFSGLTLPQTGAYFEFGSSNIMVNGAAADGIYRIEAGNTLSRIRDAFPLPTKKN